MGRLRATALLAVSLGFVGLGAFAALRGADGALGLGLACMAFFGGAAVIGGVELLPPDLPAPDAQGVTLIRPNRAHMAALTVSGALMAAAIPQTAQLMLETESPLFVTGFSIVATALFAGAALVGLWRLLQPRALYRFDHVGVASLQGADNWFVPWRAVRGVDPFVVRGMYFLALDVDPAIPRPKGVLPAVGRAAGLPPFAIGPAGSRVPFHHFAELVRHHWEHGRLLQTHN